MVDNNENLSENFAENTEESAVNSADNISDNDNASDEQNSDVVEFVDYDFDDISQAISSYDYDKATKLIKKSFNSQCNDIRIIVYKFFCDIINDHFKNLEKHIADLLEHIDQFAVNQLQPQKTIQRQSENAFNWFTKILLKGINDCIKQYNIEYPFREDNKLLETNLDNFIEVLNDKFQFDDKFTGVIEQIKNLVVLEEVEEPKAQEATPAGANNAANNATNAQGIAGTVVGANFMHLDPSLLNTENNSSKWLELQNNILIFSDLMKEHRYLEAAVFFKDINQKIINFDPREYFPDIFYQLYQAMTNNFDQVCNIIDNQQHSLEWLVTEQLFRINPEKLAQQGLPQQFSSENKFHELSSQMQHANVKGGNSSLMDIDEGHHAENQQQGDFEEGREMESNPYNEESQYSNFKDDYQNSNNELDNMYKDQENGAYDYES